MEKETEARHVDELAERWEWAGSGVRRGPRPTLSSVSPNGAPSRNGPGPAISRSSADDVFESHLSDWTSCFWSVPPLDAVRLSASNILWDVRPAAGELVGTKATRTQKALRSALSPKSSHDSRTRTRRKTLQPCGALAKAAGADRR